MPQLCVLTLTPLFSRLALIPHSYLEMWLGCLPWSDEFHSLVDNGEGLETREEGKVFGHSPAPHSLPPAP